MKFYYVALSKCWLIKILGHLMLELRKVCQTGSEKLACLSRARNVFYHIKVASFLFFRVKKQESFIDTTVKNFLLRF